MVKMTAKIIDGVAIARTIQQKLIDRISLRIANRLRPPGLAVIMVGENPASKVYVSRKHQMCQELGIVSTVYSLDTEVTKEKILSLIERLNHDPLVDGILVQLPLPKHLDRYEVMLAIAPDKDVDGFHPYNVGRLAQGLDGLSACTPKGVMTILKEIGLNLRGLSALVIGASDIVGKPMVLSLINAQATVVVCQDGCQNLADLVQQADLVISAAGVANLVKGDWIKLGATVIDVGINKMADGKLVGDVDFASALRRAGRITPVPGGVGPMTIITLMENTLYAADHLHNPFKYEH